MKDIITCYSKAFDNNGTFLNNEDKQPFSLTPSSIYTEEWKIWIIADSSASSGENPWGTYGSCDITTSSATSGVDLTKYNLYNVPSGQTDTIFAFVSVGVVNNGAVDNNKKTFGNFLDDVDFTLYHRLSGSTTAHGSAIVMDSAGNASGTPGTSGHEITISNDLKTYITDGEKLKIQAIVKSADIANCEFAGLFYTHQDISGNPVTEFIKMNGNVVQAPQQR